MSDKKGRKLFASQAKLAAVQCATRKGSKKDKAIDYAARRIAELEAMVVFYQSQPGSAGNKDWPGPGLQGVVEIAPGDLPSTTCDVFIPASGDGFC